MSKYIDAEKLKSMIREKNNTYEIGQYSPFRKGKTEALREVIELIDSLQQDQDLIIINKKNWEAQEQFRKNKDFGKPLQQEQLEVDYEKDLTEWMEAGPHTCYPWCSIPDAIEITAEHFYKLGLNARKP